MMVGAGISVSKSKGNTWITWSVVVVAREMMGSGTGGVVVELVVVAVSITGGVVVAVVAGIISGVVVASCASARGARKIARVRVRVEKKSLR